MSNSLNDFDPVPSEAFLASTCLNRHDEKEGIRWEAWAGSGKSSSRLFVSEWSRKDVKPESLPALDIATFLLGQVRASKRFICLLATDRAGTSIRPQSTALATTFFELEIFQSLVLNKPTYLLVHESFDASRLGYYLDLLSFGFPDWRDRLQRPLSDGDTVRAIEEIVTGRGKEWLVPRRVDSTAKYLEAIFLARDRFVQKEATARTHFLQLSNNAWRVDQNRQINIDAVMDLVDSRRSFEEELDNDRRLAFSWLLAHELLASPLVNDLGEVVERDPYVLRAWNLCLQDWHGAASWNGLHANIYLGTLPTLNTLDAVRAALRQMRGVELEGVETIEFPGGAYASSYYSLAKLLRGGCRRQALDIASDTLRIGWDPTAFALEPNNLAVAGSIALELGNTAEAIELFERAVFLRKRPGEQPRKLGEALCELAFARMLAGQRHRALAESRDGVELMRRPHGNGRVVVDGFLVRAMFKRAIILCRSGRIPSGLALYGEALRLAQLHKLDDQSRQWKFSGVMRQILLRVRNTLVDR